MVSILRHHIAVERKQRDRALKRLAAEAALEIAAGGAAFVGGALFPGIDGGEVVGEGDEYGGEGEEDLWEEPGMAVVSPERYAITSLLRPSP